MAGLTRGAAGHRLGMDARGYLEIYLNDHLLGATAEQELGRRAARSQRGTAAGEVLARLAAEGQQDRDALLALLERLGLAVKRDRVALGWLGEKVGRFKLNGSVLRRSPLSTVVELEGLRLTVLAKESCWRSLRAVADTHDGLDRGELDRLVARAARQAQELERLRASAAREVLAG